MSGTKAPHDPGGKVRLRLPDGVIGGATFSDCGRYRQALMRDWTPEGTPARAILFVGMNPSVADAAASDPTCHRELMFARDWGFTRYLKGNMLDWRATSPKDLPPDPALACSPANLPALREMAAEAETVVMAYGKLHTRYHTVVNEVIALMRASGQPVTCLGLNKDGSAKHPLYLRKDTILRDFPDPVTTTTQTRDGIAFDWHSDPITRATPVTGNYKSTQNVRRFFKATCGDAFKFDRAFMALMRNSVGRTMGDMADEWLKRQRP